MTENGVEINETDEKEYSESFLIVRNALGIHVRPAGVIVRALQDEPNEILFCYNSQEVNAKSILGILTLGASEGARILVRIKGKNTPETMQRLREIFENKFGET
ncbi:MAG: HPr family phosphocarrier protein [Victivallaceae bacterium]